MREESKRNVLKEICSKERQIGGFLLRLSPKELHVLWLKKKNTEKETYEPIHQIEHYLELQPVP